MSVATRRWTREHPQEASVRFLTAERKIPHTPPDLPHGWRWRPFTLLDESYILPGGGHWHANEEVPYRYYFWWRSTALAAGAAAELHLRYERALQDIQTYTGPRNRDGTPRDKARALVEAAGYGYFLAWQAAEKRATSIRPVVWVDAPSS